MKKIFTIATLLILSVNIFAQRETISKCFLSAERPKGWFKKETDDKDRMEYNYAFMPDTTSKNTAIVFSPPLSLKTTFIDTNVVDANTFCKFFEKEFPNMASDYKQIGKVEEQTIDGRKLYKLEYNLSKDGVLSHFVNYFYDNGLYSVSVIVLVAKEDDWNNRLRTFNAVIGSIKFL